MKQIVTSGIVLRRINYQEADRIITFLTPDEGKLVSMGKGVRRANSKLSGSIELFCTSQITYLPGRGNMSTLISARLIKNYGNIVKDLVRTQLTYDILKLIDKSVEDASGGEYFDLLEQVLELINNIKIDVNLTRMWFELQFLQIMGHAPDSDTTDIKESTINSYIFDFDLMKFSENENGNYNKNHIKLFLLALNHEPNQLSRIKDVGELMDKLSELVQLIMVNNGFSRL